MCPYPFFEDTPPGAAPGPPVKTGARVRRFRGCNQTLKRRVQNAALTMAMGRLRRPITPEYLSAVRIRIR